MSLFKTLRHRPIEVASKLRKCCMVHSVLKVLGIPNVIIGAVLLATCSSHCVDFDMLIADHKNDACVLEKWLDARKLQDIFFKKGRNKFPKRGEITKMRFDSGFETQL